MIEEKKPGWIDKLKTRWGLESPAQVLVVLVVFACTGFTVMWAKKPVLRFLTGEDSSTLATIIYYVCILPIYNAVLLAYGFLFGQFRFFWEFEVRFLKRLLSIFRKT
jgi:hypothetical protein